MVQGEGRAREGRKWVDYFTGFRKTSKKGKKKNSSAQEGGKEGAYKGIHALREAGFNRAAAWAESNKRNLENS